MLRLPHRFRFRRGSSRRGGKPVRPVLDYEVPSNPRDHHVPRLGEGCAGLVWEIVLSIVILGVVLWWKFG